MLCDTSSLCIVILLIQQSVLRTVASSSIVGQNTPRPCITPDNLLGSCIPMAQCARITWFLANWQQPPFPPFVSDYIRRCHCGTNGNIHYGCCALNDIRWSINPSLADPNVMPSYQLTNPYPMVSYNGLFSSNVASPNYDTSFGERLLNSMPCGTYSGERISNGETADLFEYPWMVLLEYDVGKKSRHSFLCGGTLITDRYVLTAAHCVDDKNDLIGVRLGEHNLDSVEDCEEHYSRHEYADTSCFATDIGIELIIKHPQYNARSFQNDIALIRLTRSVEFQTNIKPICLPRPFYVSEIIPEQLIISGWGVTERGYASHVLMKARIPLRTPDVCQNIFRRSLQMHMEQLCVGGIERRSTCRGDSGGPLFAPAYYGTHLRYIQYGIISAGDYSCGSKHNTPGVYTRVSAYMSWIIGQLQP